jgi:hypothetical protein
MLPVVDMVTLKQKALAHYDRMIAWAEKQPKKVIADANVMLEKLGESWHGEFCIYCKSREDQCFGCLLNPIITRFASREFGQVMCCGGLWREMQVLCTWGTWVKRARAVREYIEQHG